MKETTKIYLNLSGAIASVMLSRQFGRNIGKSIVKIASCR